FAEDDASGDMDFVYAIDADDRDGRAVRGRDRDDDIVRRRRDGFDAVIVPIVVVVIPAATARCGGIDKDAAGIADVLQRQVGGIAHIIGDCGAIGVQTDYLYAVIVDLPGRNHEVECQRIRTAPRDVVRVNASSGIEIYRQSRRTAGDIDNV